MIAAPHFHRWQCLDVVKCPCWEHEHQELTLYSAVKRGFA